MIAATSDEYANVFGFTEMEVFQAMDERGMPEKEQVRKWYDGFTFGRKTGIYNPWSLTIWTREVWSLLGEHKLKQPGQQTAS